MSAPLLDQKAQPSDIARRQRLPRLKRLKLAGRRMDLEQFLRLDVGQSDGWKYECGSISRLVQTSGRFIPTLKW